LAEDASATGEAVYEAVECLACGQLHFVSRTGKTLGDDDEA
jgi:hypothetical protein